MIGIQTPYRLPRLKNFSANAKLGLFVRIIFLVFNRWWEESDMDAEDLAKASPQRDRRLAGRRDCRL